MVDTNALNYPLDVQIICCDFLWILINIYKKCFYKSENCEKNETLVCGIHWALHTNQNTKIDLIPRSNKVEYCSKNNTTGR